MLSPDAILRLQRLCTPGENRLVFLDCETTGPDPATAIPVQIGRIGVTDYNLWGQCGGANPGCPIPPAATAVHGITDADVVDAIPAESVVPGYYTDATRAGTYVVTYNGDNYDLPMLARVAGAGAPDLSRSIDVFRLFRAKAPLDQSGRLGEAFRAYVGREPEGAHDALADCEMTAELLLAILDRHPDLPRSLPELAAYSRNPPEFASPDGFLRRTPEGIVVAIGKHRGKRLADLVKRDRGWCDWACKTLAPETVEVIRAAQRTP